MLILIREFQSPDEEMKKIVLKVMCLLLSFEKDMIINRIIGGGESLKQISYLGNRKTNLRE